MNSKLTEERMPNIISATESKIAVLGGRADTLGFKALGIATFSPEDFEPAAPSATHINSTQHTTSSGKRITQDFGAPKSSLHQILTYLASLGYETIFITEDLLAPQSDISTGTTDLTAQEDLLPNITQLLADDALPALIPIPGISGSLGLGTGAIRDSVIRAAGADIIT